MKEESSKEKREMALTHITQGIERIKKFVEDRRVHK
jgi:hypothetical protein